MQDDIQTLAGSANDGVAAYSDLSGKTLVQINGYSLASLGINDGDTLIVDRSLQAGSNDLLMVWRGSDNILCRQYQLELGDRPWGVVVAAIHNYR